MENFKLDILEKAPSAELLKWKNDQLNGLCHDKPLVLFGAGIWGQIKIKQIPNYQKLFVLFCDNNPEKQGSKVEGISVISFEELKKTYRNSYITIASLDYHNELLNQLKQNSLDRHVSLSPETLFNTDYDNYFELIKKNYDGFDAVYKLLSDSKSKDIFYDRLNYCITANSNYLIPLRSNEDQYFEHGIISLGDSEIFVDGGAYIGDTVEMFLKHTDGKFNKIYSFEPSSQNCDAYRQKLGKDDRIKLMPYGLWDKQETLYLLMNENEVGNTITESNVGTEDVPVIALDEALCGEPVSFLKMDIEGSELKALHGAENTIRAYKPKLAICVYHKPLDIVEIPLYLKSLVPEYKLFLRHYGDHQSETVLYATVG